MTKQTQCSDCSRIREVEDNVSMTICLCGNTLNFNRKGSTMKDLVKDECSTTPDNQVILKEVFQIGVDKGKPLTMDEWLDDLDTKIKVNLL